MRSWSEFIKRLAPVLLAPVLLAAGLLLRPAVALAEDYYGAREYPGFNGSGPSFNGPVEGWYCDDWYDDDDDDDDDWWYGPDSSMYERGWHYSPAGWWYQSYDGTWPANEWKFINARWYRFDEGGHMVTGWYVDAGGNHYYLNPVDDGTLGSMRIGWQIIGGKAYYFNTMSDGSLGRLLVNTTTPDGYPVGADGAMIP